MTKQEAIQVLQSIENRATDFPYMTDCDWVAIAAAKRHLQEEPISEELEEAARSYSNNLDNICGSIGEQVRNSFKAGAKWQKEQMMKDAVEATVKVDAGGYQYIPSIELYDYGKDVSLAKAGDKVKIVTIKQD